VPKQLDLDEQILAPLLEGLRAFASYDLCTLAADLQRAATSPGHRLAAVLNEPFDFGGDLGRLSRTEVLLLAMRRGGRFGADELATDLRDLGNLALEWDEEARPVVAWNAATFAYQAFEARQAGRRTVDPSPAELLGEQLYEELIALEDAAGNCRQRVAMIVESRQPIPTAKPGRPVKYPGLAVFASQRQAKGSTAKDIAEAWLKKTGQKISADIVRNALKRARKKQR
jgi:hypothetical protein